MKINVSRFSSASKIGPRDVQDDVTFHLPIPGGCLIGVMDGFGTRRTARTCLNRMENFFWFNGEYPTTSLKKLLKELDRVALETTGGTSFSAVLIQEETGSVVTAVLGRSPVIVALPGHAPIVSPTHDILTNSYEVKAAVERGGIIRGDYLAKPVHGGHLATQVTRCLGDAEMGSIMGKEPDIDAFMVDPGATIAITTSSFFQTEKNNQPASVIAREMIELAKSGKVARDLLAWRELSGLTANTSIVLWQALG